MDHDMDRLIDSAFEHDRARLPTAKRGIPEDLLQRASQSVVATGAASLPLWLKLGAGMLAVGGVTAYFATRTAPLKHEPPALPSPAVVVDSPVITRDTIAAGYSTSNARRTPQPVQHEDRTLSLPPPTLPEPIRDSVIHTRDSIRDARRKR
jgi:hypothetical protein